MNITLRAHERLFINGAVIRADRRVTIELMNDVVFLLENHVIQPSEATTPLRQIYFVAQVILMDGRPTDDTKRLVNEFLDKAMATFRNEQISEGLKRVKALLDKERYFETLKALRALYALEAQELVMRDGIRIDAA